MAGRDFVAGFLTRHSNVSLRKPEAISLNRLYGLNKVSVEKYFENLARVLDTYNLELLSKKKQFLSTDCID